MIVKTPIYLDSNSTTKTDKRVVEVMIPYLSDNYGNSSSNHSFGWIAKSAVENARDLIASFLKVNSKEIIFTSGATESINIVHLGLADYLLKNNGTIVTTNIEHSASVESLGFLESRGIKVKTIGVTQEGLIDSNKIISAIDESTKLISLIYANNEIGTINDIEAVSNYCKNKDILIHVDATQVIGKLRINLSKLNVDFVSFTAHKLYGPKGIGALFIKSERQYSLLKNIIWGGTQERNIRPGTLNVPSIVGFGKAIEILDSELESDYEHTKSLRDRLYKNIIANLDDVKINGSISSRLPNNLNLLIEKVKADKLMLELRDLAFSNSSACASGSSKPSRILKAIGLSDEQALSSVRFGLSKFNTIEEIEYSAERIVDAVNKIRQLNH
jgi:cysteine desulfurase